ncbi:MAG: tryptophan-rich sensory protein [Bacteroidota bacterium]|jgi:tryptophan-rich sensory protein|nr:tryptophan-rich sensory protein [Bacteroidota bacterium]
MEKFNAFKLILSVLIIMALGALSGIVTASQITTWYAQLQKPFFNPPNVIFAPVWTLLYALMGISFYLLWNSKSSLTKNMALLFFILQFIFNLAWSFIFFYLHKTGWALAEILGMWGLIVLTIKYSFPIQKWAAWLLVPYLLWVSFATILNAAIYILN